MWLPSKTISNNKIYRYTAELWVFVCVGNVLLFISQFYTLLVQSTYMHILAVMFCIHSNSDYYFKVYMRFLSHEIHTLKSVFDDGAINWIGKKLLSHTTNKN